MESINRIQTTDKGVDRKLYIGESDIKGQVHLHWYGSEKPGWAEFRNFDIEEFVAAVNSVPGITATYEKPEPPKPLLSEIPDGTAFHFGDGVGVGGRMLYIKLTGDRLYSKTFARIAAITPGDLSRVVTIVEEYDDHD